MMTESRVAFLSNLRVLALFFAAALVMAPGASGHAQSLLPSGTGVSANVVPLGSAFSADDPPVPVFRSRTDEVNVIFTVTDKHNKFVKDLKQAQFTILDNNMPPRQVTNFESETDLPLRVGLLIDASNSIKDRFSFEQQASIEFLRQIIRPRTDKAFILAFDEATDLTQDFTSDMNQLTRGVNVIRPGGGTALWDAVFTSCRDKLMNERAEGTNGTVRKAIILVSDGDDNQSRMTRQEAYDMAQRSGVMIYAISTNLSNIYDNGDRNLKMLAEATGGRAFFPSKIHDLTGAFKSIQEELRSQYSVSYKPDQFDGSGKYRPIQIVAENKKFHVRAKKGYFVPRQ
jgi:Ca-activated chloride channel homolog